MNTDIAVLECRRGLEWEIVAYIGPDREGGLISDNYDESENYDGCDLRIRYLNKESK